MSSIVATGVPTGGAITLQITSSGAVMTLSRAVSGVSGPGPFTQLYSGAPQQFFVDVGDLLPAPLDAGTLYIYQLTDASGTLLSNAVQPASELNLEIEPLTFMMVRLLQGAVNTLTLPAGIRKMQVTQAMPIVGMPALPFIVVNLDVLDQEEIPIGQSVQHYEDINTWTVTGLAEWSYKISILSDNALERDFYRDAMPGIFNMIQSYVMAPAGKDVVHRYQIASGQVADDIKGKGPGFYYADALLIFRGTLNVVVTATYGLIAEIDFTATGPDSVTTEAIMR